jgi:hypothetical protein
MSAPQFTPGPWQSKHDYTVEGATTIIANVDGESFSDGTTTHTYDFIATCEDEYGERLPNAQANARLICAAPDLFDGCNAMLGLAQLLLGRDDLPAEVREALTTSHRIRDAEAAVAKAEGGQ